MYRAALYTLYTKRAAAGVAWRGGGRGGPTAGNHKSADAAAENDRHRANTAVTLTIRLTIGKKLRKVEKKIAEQRVRWRRRTGESECITIYPRGADGGTHVRYCIIL